MTFQRTVNSVTVDYMSYIGAWGKQPRGYGSWAFYFGDERTSRPRFYTGGFADCTRQAVREAKTEGFRRIFVGS